MGWNIISTSVYHDTKTEIESQKTIKRNKKLVRFINSLIDELISKNPYNKYTIYDKQNYTNCKVAIETNVFGKNPRYIIEWIQSYSENGIDYYNGLFDYYSGITYKFTGHMESHSFEELRLHGNLYDFLKHIQTNTDNKRALRICNKIQDYAIKSGIVDRLL